VVACATASTACSRPHLERRQVQLCKRGLSIDLLDCLGPLLAPGDEVDQLLDGIDQWRFDICV